MTNKRKPTFRIGFSASLNHEDDLFETEIPCEVCEVETEKLYRISQTIKLTRGQRLECRQDANGIIRLYLQEVSGDWHLVDGQLTVELDEILVDFEQGMVMISHSELDLRNSNISVGFKRAETYNVLSSMSSLSGTQAYGLVAVDPANGTRNVEARALELEALSIAPAVRHINLKNSMDSIIGLKHYQSPDPTEIQMEPPKKAQWKREKNRYGRNGR